MSIPGHTHSTVLLALSTKGLCLVPLAHDFLQTQLVLLILFPTQSPVFKISPKRVVFVNKVLLLTSSMGGGTIPSPAGGGELQHLPSHTEKEGEAHNGCMAPAIAALFLRLLSLTVCFTPPTL